MTITYIRCCLSHAMASSTEILALCDMLKQSKLHVCISIRVVASFGRKITGGVGAPLLVSDARSP